MIKYLDLKGIEVVNRKGKSAGIIEDCILDIRNKRICSAVLKKKGIFDSFCIIKLNNLSEFKDLIIYDGEFHNINRKVIKLCKENMMGSYISADIIDVNGRRVGNLMDVLIDENSGTIKALLCSRGFFDDIFCGRKVIVLDDGTILGRDKIIISDSSIDFTNNISFKNLLK